MQMTNLLIGGVICFFGFGALAAGYFTLKSQLAFDAVAVHTTGEVLEIEYRPPMRNGRPVAETHENPGTYYPVITFEDSAGAVQTWRTFQGFRKPAFEPGDVVEIRYDPANPAKMTLPATTNPWFALIFFVAVGLPFAIIGTLYLRAGFGWGQAPF